GKIDELFELAAIGDRICTAAQIFAGVYKCGAVGRQPGSCGVHGKVEWPIDPESNPRGKSGQRTQSQIETRDAHRVHRRETSTSDTFHRSRWHCEDNSISLDFRKRLYRLTSLDLDTKLPGPLLQPGDQCLPSSVEIKHATRCGASKLFQSRTSAQKRQIGRVRADAHQHGNELANSWRGCALLNPFFEGLTLVCRAARQLLQYAGCLQFFTSVEQARRQKPACRENLRVHPAIAHQKRRRACVGRLAGKRHTPAPEGSCGYTVPVQSVRSEIQEITAILLRDRTASQSTRLLQKRYLVAALTCECIGGGEAGQAASNNDISLHPFLPILISQLGRARYPFCDS